MGDTANMPRRSATVAVFSLALTILLSCSNSEADKKKEGGDNSAAAPAGKMKGFASPLPAGAAVVMVTLNQDGTCTQTSSFGTNGNSGYQAYVPKNYSVIWVASGSNNATNSITVSFAAPAATVSQTTTPYYSFSDAGGVVSAPPTNQPSTSYYSDLVIGGTHCKNVGGVGGGVINPLGIIMM